MGNINPEWNDVLLKIKNYIQQYGMPKYAICGSNVSRCLTNWFKDNGTRVVIDDLACVGELKNKVILYTPQQEEYSTSLKIHGGTIFPLKNKRPMVDMDSLL